MIPAETIIHRAQRDLTVGALLRWVLVAGAVGCLLFGPLIGGHFDGMISLIVIGVVWMMLSYRSIKGAKIAAGSFSLIASGQYEEAEEHIQKALTSFSLFRNAKIMSLHHLAVLRHAQRRWSDAAALSRAVLGQRLGTLQSLSKSSRLILAEAMLEMGDLQGAYEAISGLYQQKLTLGEAIQLQLVQLDYLTRISAWGQMMTDIVSKVQLAELMPSPQAARAQSFLALAAKKLGYLDWAQWLRRRAELLVDKQEIVKDRPVLGELWAD